MIAKAAMIAAVGFGGTTMIHEEPVAAPAGQRPASASSVPQGVPLTGRSLVEAIKGNRLRVDLSVFQYTIPFSETFHDDGTWTASRRSLDRNRASRGKWSIKHNQICVVAERGRSGCRRIRRDIKSHQLLMSDFYGEPNLDFFMIVAPRH